MGWFKDSINWLGDRAEAAGRNTFAAGAKVLHAVTHPVETATAIKDTVVDAATTAKDAVVSAGEWIGEKAYDGYEALENGIKYVKENPREALAKTGEALKTAAVETGKFAHYCVTNPDRASLMVAQGVTNAVVGTVGSVCDLGVGIYNHGIRHVVNGQLAFVGLEGVEKFDYSCTDKWTAGCTFAKPENGYEKTLMYGTQAIGEVGSFIALTAATGGVYGGVRATAAGARGATLVTRAAQTSAAFGRAVLPTTCKTAFTEAAIAGGLFTTNMVVSNAEEKLDTVLATELGLTPEQLMKMTLEEKSERIEEFAEKKISEALSAFGMTEEEIKALSPEEKNERLEGFIKEMESKTPAPTSETSYNLSPLPGGIKTNVPFSSSFSNAVVAAPTEPAVVTEERKPAAPKLEVATLG